MVSGWTEKRGRCCGGDGSSDARFGWAEIWVQGSRWGWDIGMVVWFGDLVAGIVMVDEGDVFQWVADN